MPLRVHLPSVAPYMSSGNFLKALAFFDDMCFQMSLLGKECKEKHQLESMCREDKVSMR